jgi:hypothetical protein
MALFGPRPGIVVSARTPSGMASRSSSSAAMAPVSRYSRILITIDLPTLGIAAIAFSSSRSISVWYIPTERAAFS